MNEGNRHPAFREVSDGVMVSLRVAPRSRRNRVEGIVAEADGTSALKIAVTAAPEDGKANDAVIALLAKTWGIPKRQLHIRQGAAARRKLLHIVGDPRTLIGRLSAMLRDPVG